MIPRKVSTRRKPLILPSQDGVFVAIDFETADHGPDSACAVGLVRVEGGEPGEPLAGLGVG